MLDKKYIKMGFSFGLGLGLAALVFGLVGFLIQCLIVAGIALHAGQMGTVSLLALFAFIAVVVFLLLIATMGKFLGQLVENRRLVKQADGQMDQ